MLPARERPAYRPSDRRRDARASAAHRFLSGEAHLSVGPAPDCGIRRVWERRARFPTAAGSTLAILISCLLTLPFAYTFWALLTIAFRLLGMKGLPGWGVPAALALLTGWAILYLGIDRTALLGNRRARAALLEKSRRLLRGPLPATRFFVEARTARGRFPLRHDLGWLFVYPDRLVFIGDAQTAIIPLTQIAGPPRRETNWLGLEGTWLNVKLRHPWGRLRLLCRDDAARLSETARNALRLHSTLRQWMRL